VVVVVVAVVVEAVVRYEHDSVVPLLVVSTHSCRQ